MVRFSIWKDHNFAFLYLFFICCLFNDAVSSSDNIASSDKTIDELEIIWKKTVVAL
jgi:hypothetical protein